MYWNSPNDRLVTQVEYQVYWVAPAGRYREARVSLLPGWSGELRMPQVLGGVVVPAPLVLGGLVGIFRPRELLAERGLPRRIRRRWAGR